MIVSEEQYREAIVLIANRFQVAFDEARVLVENLFRGVNDSWEELNALIKEYHEQPIVEDKPSWNTPKKSVMRNQVLNRKPLMSRARSTC